MSIRAMDYLDQRASAAADSLARCSGENGGRFLPMRAADILARVSAEGLIPSFPTATLARCSWGSGLPSFAAAILAPNPSGFGVPRDDAALSFMQ